MNYGDVALGVECALPSARPQPRVRVRPRRARSLIRWLAMALKRWG